VQDIDPPQVRHEARSMSPLDLALGIGLLTVGGAMVLFGRARDGEARPFLRQDFIAMIYLLVCLLFLVAGSAVLMAQILGA
jgi:hypothetical protein